MLDYRNPHGDGGAGKVGRTARITQGELSPEQPVG